MTVSKLILKHKLHINGLKTFVSESLPKGSYLRDVILAEDDELGAEEFLIKMDTWLKLLRTEFS